LLVITLSFCGIKLSVTGLFKGCAVAAAPNSTKKRLVSGFTVMDFKQNTKKPWLMKARQLFNSYAAITLKKNNY
jgi:hypothetical protein